MQVSNNNGVKVYSITSASRSAIPDWLARRNQKKLKNDQTWRNRIELIQDFEFPEASLRLKETRDGNYLVATGVYQPQMRVFELAQMSMKFDRHTEAENMLSDDWTKAVLLQTDRSIELHSQFGMHYKTRVPKFGRDIAYHYPSCDLMAVGSSSEVWRLNLEQGRFLSSLQTTMPAINVASICPAHQLFGFGGSNGVMEFWDPRDRKRIGVLDVGTAIARSVDASVLEALPEVTSLRFAADGLSFAAGASTGQIVLYDLRRPTPVLLKDHQYGYPIKSIHFHTSGNVISADAKVVKIWDKADGKAFTSIEAQYDINDVCVGSDTGLVMLANEGVQMQSYYIPQLGPAPRWCPFLDNLTEELEENPTTTIYDDYKFVTRKDLTNLGLDHLVGTNVLKAYMHGFFVDLRLYEKAKAIANPFEFEEHKRRMVQQKMEEQRKSRITAIKKLPKVNRNLAAKLALEGPSRHSESDGEGSGDDGKKPKRLNPNQRKRVKEAEMRAQAATEDNPLGDSRFSALFQDPDFQLDEDSHEFRLHYPSQAAAAASQKFDRVEDEDQDGSDEDLGYGMSDPEGNASDSDKDDGGDDSGSDDDAIRFARHDKRGNKTGRPITAAANRGAAKKKRGGKPGFFEIKDGFSARDLLRGGNNPRAATSGMAFGDRVRVEQTGASNESISRNVAGNMSISFRPGSGRGRRGGRGGRGGGGAGGDRGSGADGDGARGERRGVRDLGLKRLPGARGRVRGRGGFKSR
ncbi:Small ribosomal subunit biogenesis [Polyrhizophydium stewartii]|uniref:Small ribosomal subunit biogenesis n=1 Tax=Polyrhizophydium stewartii TaxID=2732419 RepID=A0ABR4NGH4_9FUNG